MPKPKGDPVVPSAYDPALTKILAESTRLKRQSADLLKRIAELDEQLAARLPIVPPKRPRPN